MFNVNMLFNVVLGGFENIYFHIFKCKVKM